MDDIQRVSMSSEDVKKLDEVDDVVSRAVISGDPTLAFNFGSKVIGEGLTRGKMLAKLLYKLDQSWPSFVAAGIEDDLPTMAFTQMGVKPITTVKYIMMWTNVIANEDIPEKTRDALLTRPINDLLALEPGIRDGSLTDEDIENAAWAVDGGEVKNIIRRRRGSKTNSDSAILIFIQRQDSTYTPVGTVYAKQGRKKEVLFTVNEDLSEMGKRAIERIIKRTGIQEVYVA